MKKILLSLAIACSITSCDIERLPYDSVDSNVAISDPNYASNALVGIYGNLKSKLSNSWINEAHRLMEYNGDNVSLSGTTGDDLFYIYNYHRIDNGGRVNRFWVKSYQVIYGANAAIENIAEGVNVENDNYLGEAYFLRAMMYLPDFVIASPKNLHQRVWRFSDAFPSTLSECIHPCSEVA